MSRVIRYFNKSDESFCGEYYLEKEPLIKDLQVLFQVNESNPMYDSFLILHKHAEFLEQYSNKKFKFELYDYYLDYD